VTFNILGQNTLRTIRV